MSHFIFIDEANFILSKAMQQHSSSGNLKVLEFIKLCRGFMESVVMGTNHPSDIVESAHVNCLVKIMMHLGHWNNIYAFGKASALSYKQMDSIPQLQQGQGILTKEGTKPYWIKFLPFPHPLREVTNKEVNERCQPILSQYEIKTRKDTLSIEELQKMETCPKCGTGRLILKEGPYGEFIGCDQFPKCNYTANIKQESPMLTTNDQKLLMDIAIRPTDTKTTHYKNIGLSMDKGNRTTNRLLKYNLIRELAINLGGRQREAKILYLTEEGYKTINMQPPQQLSRGEGPEHSFWIKLIHKNLKENGTNAVTNHSLKGKEPDIAVLKQNGEIWAIEISISTTATHELNQIRKDLKAGYDHIIALTKNAKKTQDISDLILNAQEINQNKVSIAQLTPNITSILERISEKGGEEKI
jgi:hypothetical protein